MPALGSFWLLPLMAEPRLTSSYTDRPVHDESRHSHHKRNSNQLRFIEIRKNALNSKLRVHIPFFGFFIARSFDVPRKKHRLELEKRPFPELRAISNGVLIGNDRWDMHGSIRAMTEGVRKLIATLRRSKHFAAPRIPRPV